MNQSQVVKEFIAKVARVCNEFGMSISHEDSYGAFLIEDFSPSNIEWLEEALDRTTPRPIAQEVIDRIKPV